MKSISTKYLQKLNIYDFYNDIESFNYDMGDSVVIDYIKNIGPVPTWFLKIPFIVFILKKIQYSHTKFANQTLKEWKVNAKEGIYKDKENFVWLYNILNDELSKQTLISNMAYRLTGDMKHFHAYSDFAFKQYFDLDLLSLTKQTVFVDCGGYIGDTTEMFLQICPEFKRCYVYEPEKKNYLRCKNYMLSKHPNHINSNILILKKMGVGNDNCSLPFLSDRNGESHIITDPTMEKIEIVSLDSDILEPISFIKMDIEGFEKDAIYGARNHLINEKPKLAICVYHKPTDIWELPKIISEIQPNYKFYLRQYHSSIISPHETVLYCI